MEVLVNSPNTKYTENFIESVYEYQTTFVEKTNDRFLVTPRSETINIRTCRKVSKLGVMLVGWGGNNGSSFTAGVLANKLGLSWPTRNGIQHANWYGSITQASTIRLGSGLDGEDVYVGLNTILPMVNPDDIEIDGWDISSANLFESIERARVLEPCLQQQLKSYLEPLKPRPSIYAPDFINKNQERLCQLRTDQAEHLDGCCIGVKVFLEASDVYQIFDLFK